MTKTVRVSLLVFVLGCVIAAVGISLYQAWWTAAFAIGGAVPGWFGRRLTTPARSIAIGAAASGAALLGGMSLFFLFGGFIGGGTPWLLAGVGSVGTAVVLVLVVRRLLMGRAQARDIQQH